MRVLFVLGIVLTWATTVATADAKVLFIGKAPDHPYATHMYMHTCGILAKCVKNTEGVETIVSEGWPDDTAVLDGVSTIVVYTTPAAELLIDGPHRDEFVAMMKRGVGLVTIHWASSVFEQNLQRLGPAWTSYMGGVWVSNVGLHTGDSPLEQLVPEHPICRGWQEFELHDEYYLDPTITEATPLLRVTTPDKAVVVGWVYERPDGGRAFATTLGHFYSNFQREPFRRMIVNGILWTAGLEVTAEGANVALSDEDLALPPKPE
jgi:type 1 glutamine amidotransferase